MVYTETPKNPCILFVDEEAINRRFVKLTLEAEGYQVLTARNSVEALALAADYPGAIDCLLTDPTTRPFHNGLELASCFNVLRPETCVAFTSPEALTGSSLLETVESLCIPVPA